MNRTATIERYHVYGTSRFHLRVTYRGFVLRWSEMNPAWCIVYADAWHLGDDTVNAMIQHAKRSGFTRVKFSGDWTHSRKPVGGSIARILKA